MANRNVGVAFMTPNNNGLDASSPYNRPYVGVQFIEPDKITGLINQAPTTYSQNHHRIRV